MPTISTLSKIWGYSGADTLALDIGAGYSKIEAVHEGSAYVLKGTNVKLAVTLFADVTLLRTQVAPLQSPLQALKV